MKHLKLFEAFDQSDKITSVNNIIVGYFLFNYFVNNDIRVSKSNSGGVYGFEKDGSRFLLITCDQTQEEVVFRTPYTRSHFLPAFSGLLNHYITINLAYARFSGDECQGIIWAMLKYINYLRTTPEKNHLLSE